LRCFKTRRECLRRDTLTLQKLMSKIGSTLFAVLMLVGSSFAAHPQLLLDADELAFIRNKVANHTADWQTLKDRCDALTTFSVQWPDAVTGGSSSIRGYVVGSARSSGMIQTGFNGKLFETAITELGACYQALKPTSPASAAKYLAQARNIITAMSQPPLTLIRKSDGAIRYAAALDLRGKDLVAGAPLGVYLPRSITGSQGDSSKSVSVGEIWTIGGATGCTSMNGTWRVSAKNGNVVAFANSDGSPAPVLNANCTLFTFVPLRDSGFALRFWIPALAKAYDWFYDGLSQRERDNLVLCMNAWLYEMAVTGLHTAHPENNYSFGNFWALVAAYVATDSDNTVWTSFYARQIADRFLGDHQMRDYRQLWMAGGGFGEGWQAYGYNATRLMMDAALAMKLHGIDWTQPPYHFSFVDDTLRYWMEFTTPTKLALDDNEYVFPIRAVDKGVTETVWIPLGHAVMFTATARRFHSPLAPQFQSWYKEVYAKLHAAAGKSVPAWSTGVYPSQPALVDEFLYYDSAARSADWKTLPLTYRAWSGNYAVSRSDWTDSAVEVTLLGGPTLGSAGNGKTQFNSGSITMQRGDDRLVVYGLGEASRAGDILNAEQFNRQHSERGTYGNRKNSIFWAGASLSESRNQGLSSRKSPPGQSNKVTSWGSTIDRADDTGSYTYWRARGLEANNAKSAIDGMYHQSEWTREVFFLRPKVVIVHDRTAVLNDKDDRAMFWSFGRNINRPNSGLAAGMTRYDVSYKGRYRGAFTSVIPASPQSVSVVDHNGMHYLYRVEVRPTTLDHKVDYWLAVLDAADSAAKVTSVASIAATNADAVRLQDLNHTVVAFVQSSAPTLPISIALTQAGDTYIAGLGANTNYQVTFSGTTLTIADDNGTHRVMSTAAGVLHVPHM
jgi:hypothetical protein